MPDRADRLQGRDGSSEKSLISQIATEGVPSATHRAVHLPHGSATPDIAAPSGFAAVA